MRQAVFLRVNKKMNKNNFLNADELAKYLCISKVTVYRLTESRKIPFYKISGCIRFKMEDVERYLEENRVEAMNWK